jgi:hypothetical protein
VHRRHLLIGASTWLLLSPSRARAAGAMRDFDPAGFRAAQEAGQGIVVYVHAPW